MIKERVSRYLNEIGLQNVIWRVLFELHLDATSTGGGCTAWEKRKSKFFSQKTKNGWMKLWEHLQIRNQGIFT